MRVETIQGKSLYEIQREADQRQELRGWQRRHPEREVHKVEIKNHERQGQYYQWTITVTYKEKRP